MTSLRNKILFAAALPLAGCMPMEQVSLVYSSKADIGIGIASGTSASPGLDLHVGFHTLDAAFVPVAFAKHCAQPTDCGEINYDAAGISGSNSVAGLSAADERSIDNLTQEIAAKRTEIAGNDKRISILQEQIALVDSLPAKKIRQKELGAVDPATNVAKVLTAEEQKEKTALDAEITRADALQKPALTKERDDLVAANVVLNTDATTARSKLDLVTSTVNKQTSDTKMDAYSVYGTFNGNAAGSGSAASLTGGKVFSTGIAAQNLTQGVSTASRTDAMARCLDAAAKLLASDALQGEAHAKERQRIAGMCTITIPDD